MTSHRTWTGFGPRSLDGGLDEIRLADDAGSLWLCGKHVVGPDPEAALVRAGNAGLIVCLNEVHEIDGRYPGYVSWLRTEAAGSGADATPRALWRPIPDLHAPGIDEVRPLVDQIVSRLGAGVIIHCGAGIGRAPTVAVCTMLALGYELDDALAVVSERRPMAGPESGAQQTLVESFALTVRPGPTPAPEGSGGDARSSTGRSSG